MTDYAVKGGDTLSTIAQSKLGDANRWPEIYAANKSEMGSGGRRSGEISAVPRPSLTTFSIA
jgi:nucleoid-associated protein YgaU